MAIALIVGGYIVHAKPMVSPLANRLEIMNELTILAVTYGHLHFTDYMPEPEARNSIGYVYMGVIFVNISVHLVILIRDTYIKGKFALK